MTLTVPTAGTPVLDTWGAEVANKLNRIQLATMDADVVTDSATAVDLTDLAFTVENGKYYLCQVSGAYQVSAMGKGLQLSFSHPGGVGQFQFVIFGNGSETGLSRHRTNGDGGTGLVGRTGTDASGSYREFRGDLWYQATADGTIQFRCARGGSSGGTGLTVEASTSLLVIADS